MSLTTITVKMSQFWSKLVHELVPYTPGEQPQIDGLIKLNTNENPYGPSPKVLAAIAAANSDTLRKYPDPNASHLKQALAADSGLDINQVFVGNSSDEVLAHVFKGLLKQDAPLLFPDLTYSFYPVYCKLFEIDSVQVPLDENFEIDIDAYDQECGGIIFANPNAPTGIALPLSKIRLLAKRHPNRVLVIDEAYVDFARESAVSLISEFDNILVTQTFSKSRSLAGLRVGMAYGQAHLIEALERVKNSFHPYALDSLALAGATASLQDNNYFTQCIERINQTRAKTISSLEAIGFNVLPSQANFILARHQTQAASELFTFLRSNKIIVRHFAHPRINNFLRISISSDDEMQTLVDVLSERCRSTS
jgi:histidinol-phosphate aminotransferase